MKFDNTIKPKRRPLYSQEDTISDMNKYNNECKAKIQERKSISQLTKIIFDEDK